MIVDTAAPIAPAVALTLDPALGGDTRNQVTLVFSGIEPGGAAAYSIDGGVSWSDGFAPATGGNIVTVGARDAAAI